MEKFNQLEKLRRSWKNQQGRQGNINQLNKSDMEAIISKQASDTSTRFSRIYVIAMFFQSLGLALLAVDLYKYGSVQELKYASAVSISLLLAIFIYTLDQYQKLRQSDMQSGSIFESLKTKIRFYKTSFRIWLVPYALSVVILTFSVNLYHEGLSFPLTIVEAYPLLLVYLTAFLLMYFTARFSYATYLKAYQIYLRDLQEGVLQNVRAETRRYRTITKVFILVIAFVIVLGMLMLILGS